MGGTFQTEVSQIAFLILCSEPLARLVCLNSHSCNAQHIWKKHVFRSLAVNGEKRDFPSHSSDSEITPNGLCGPIIRDISEGPHACKPLPGIFQQPPGVFLHSRKITHISDKDELLNLKERVWFIPAVKAKQAELKPSSQPIPGLLWARTELKTQVIASSLLFDLSQLMTVS